MGSHVYTAEFTAYYINMGGMHLMEFALEHTMGNVYSMGYPMGHIPLVRVTMYCTIIGCMHPMEITPEHIHHGIPRGKYASHGLNDVLNHHTE